MTLCCTARVLIIVTDESRFVKCQTKRSVAFSITILDCIKLDLFNQPDGQNISYFEQTTSFKIYPDASFSPNLRQTRSRQHDRKCRLKSSHVKSIYFHHPSQGNSTNYYLILGLRDKAASPTSQQINKFPTKRVKNLATPSSISFLFFIHRSALLSANQRQ